jgi:hypothetical protein
MMMKKNRIHIYYDDDDNLESRVVFNLLRRKNNVNI